MAYEKHTWECGETITADKLNHMEEGISESGDDGFVLEVDKIRITSDNTIIRNHWTS